MKLKAIAIILLVILAAGCSNITNPFQDRSGEYINSREHADLKIGKHLNAKHKSDRYIISPGKSECGVTADESLIVPPV